MKSTANSSSFGTKGRTGPSPFEVDKGPRRDHRLFRRLCFDVSGGAAIEFSFTAPIYFLMLIGLLQIGVWFWADVALQRGAEAAARCAALLSSSTCTSTSAIQSVASAQTKGIYVPASTFVVSTSTCGNKVSATYTVPSFTTALGLPAIKVSASACYPTPP